MLQAREYFITFFKEKEIDRSHTPNISKQSARKDRLKITLHGIYM